MMNVRRQSKRKRTRAKTLLLQFAALIIIVVTRLKLRPAKELPTSRCSFIGSTPISLHKNIKTNWLLNELGNGSKMNYISNATLLLRQQWLRIDLHKHANRSCLVISMLDPCDGEIIIDSWSM